MSLKKSFYNKKILITCGPTWVPIDKIRIIGSTSTGRLAQAMAQALAENGAKVTLLEGPVEQHLKIKGIKVIKFFFYEDLLFQIKRELKKKYHLVIHAAAVSDYRLKKPFKRKIDSHLPSLKLVLVQTPKIINLVKRISPESLLIGFKQESELTPGLAKLKTKKLFRKAHCDFVIANRVNKSKYEGYVLDRKLNILDHVYDRQQLAQSLIRILKGVI